MALKYYSRLSECLDGDLFILLPNLLVCVKVCGLQCYMVGFVVRIPKREMRERDGGGGRIGRDDVCRLES